MHSLPPWLVQARQRAHASDPNRLGSVRFIDENARRRGIQSITAQQTFALGRAPEQGGGWDVELQHSSNGSFVGVEDSLSISCHGRKFTHVDGLDHVYAQDRYEDGGTSSASALSRWASEAMITTRAVLVDIPNLRGVPWVSVDQPVTGAEIDRALSHSDATFESGDALLIYSGRDRFEAAGHIYASTALSVDGRPGVGTSGAEWIADHEVGAVGWDFMDARSSDGSERSAVHPLIWAIGLVLIDNCNLGSLASVMRRTGQATGFFNASFPALDGVTGFPVNPLVIV